MGGVKLLEEARAAGLKVRAEGDRLIVRGPKSAEPVAKALLAKKAEVLALLHRQPDYRSLYRQAAEAVQEDCYAIDPCWLANRHPELWEQMVTLDHALTLLEQQEAPDPEYRHTLERLCDVVRQARALYERQKQRAEPVQQRDLCFH